MYWFTKLFNYKMSDNYITICIVNEVENQKELSEKILKWL